MTTHSLDATLSEADGVTLATRGGLVLRLRPVSPADASLVASFFDHLLPEDLRFRFLSGRSHLSPDQLAMMIGVDHRHSEHLLAFESKSGALVASLMLVADEHMEVAEVAIAVTPDFKGQGIGWALLKHAAELARERGIRKLRSIESRANHQAIEVERALGFTCSDYAGDATLMLVEAHLG